MVCIQKQVKKSVANHLEHDRKAWLNTTQGRAEKQSRARLIIAVLWERRLAIRAFRVIKGLLQPCACSHHLGGCSLHLGACSINASTKRKLSCAHRCVHASIKLVVNNLRLDGSIGISHCTSGVSSCSHQRVHTLLSSMRYA